MVVLVIEVSIFLVEGLIILSLVLLLVVCYLLLMNSFCCIVLMMCCLFCWVMGCFFGLCLVYVCGSRLMCDDSSWLSLMNVGFMVLSLLVRFLVVVMLFGGSSLGFRMLLRFELFMRLFWLCCSSSMVIWW